MSLANSIRTRRKSLNITLQALADRTGADAGNLSRIERGELGINEALLRKVASALDCTPAYLYAMSETNPSLYKPALTPQANKDSSTGFAAPRLIYMRLAGAPL